jgi:electron-transferring-flavoprotein dehydrogenase
MPQLYADGVLLVGDCAGFLNSQRLKGIHTAIKSGMLAAETIFEAMLAGDYSARQLQRYETLVQESWIMPELRKVRNFHAGFSKGRWLGIANAGLQFLTGGRSWGLFDRVGTEPGHVALKKLSDYGYQGDALEQRYDGLRFDGKVTFNKLTDVYEMVEDPSEAGKRRLQINFSNCVHCKTCDIMDPYQIINWVTPEGGGGPDYKNM